MPIPKVSTFERSIRMTFSWSSLFLLFILALAFAGGMFCIIISSSVHDTRTLLYIINYSYYYSLIT